MSNEKQILASIKIEWNFDMEKETISFEQFRSGDFSRASIKGRCKRCWGRAIGRINEMHEVTGIKCLVCGRILKGREAQTEYKRMSDESTLNLMNMGGVDPV